MTVLKHSRYIIITGADARFFDLVKGCIESLQAGRADQSYSLAFFDLGCSADQLAWLGSHVDFIKVPGWDYELPERHQVAPYYRAMLARPYLRRYFPGFEVYLWIDADAWVQDWSAIDLFVRGAQLTRGAAIVPELDRGIQTPYGRMPQEWSKVRGWYDDLVGPELAVLLHTHPMLNAGVFAFHADAPHWQGPKNMARTCKSVVPC